MTSSTTPSEVWPATVLMAGFDPAPAGEPTDLEARVLPAPTAEEALELLGIEQITVLCVGARLQGSSARTLLEDAKRRFPELRTVNIVLTAGPEPELFQELLDNDDLYYLSRQLPRPADIRNILSSAVRYRREPDPIPAEADHDIAGQQAALELARLLAGERTSDHGLALTRQAIEQLVEADRADCLIYNPQEEILWTRQPDSDEERVESAAAGLVSFVVRTGTAVCLEHIGQDPRYDPEADNDGGPLDQRFLAVPVIGKNQRQLAVLVALRHAAREPFLDRDRTNLQFLADQVSPSFARFALQARLDELSELQHTALGTEAARVFRREALEEHNRGLDDQGHLLELSPSWTPWAYRLLLAVFIATLLYSFFGTVREYATGAAVIRVDNRTEISSLRAPHAGEVSDLRVRPVQHLQPGQAVPSLTAEDPHLSVITLFPGHYRPMIQPGMALRLELQGYRFAYQYLIVETVGEKVVGPAEARRLLGSAIGDAVPISGPVVFVHAHLPSERFESGGRTYELHDGMQGIAEIEVRSDRILSTLIPGLTLKLPAS